MSGCGTRQLLLVRQDTHLNPEASVACACGQRRAGQCGPPRAHLPARPLPCRAGDAAGGPGVRRRRCGSYRPEAAQLGPCAAGKAAGLPLSCMPAPAQRAAHGTHATWMPRRGCIVALTLPTALPTALPLSWALTWRNRPRYWRPPPPSPPPCAPRRGRQMALMPSSTAPALSRPCRRAPCCICSHCIVLCCCLQP